MMKAPEEARDYFVRAAAKQPNLVSVREQILRIDFQLLDKQNAREHARNLLRLDRLNGFANYVLGSLAIDGMAYDEAEAYLRRSIDAGPNVANLNDLAVVLIHKRQYEEAAVRVKQAMEADSTVGAVWDTLALIQMHDGKLDEAEASLSQSIKLDPEDLRTHMHLADVMYRKGNLLRASELVRFVAEEAHTLPRDDLENFDRLHVAVLGVKYTRKH